MHSQSEIICPNCNNATKGNYCAQCGQPTHLHKETFWHMVLHFAGHYFHFESKLWKTFYALIFKPGQLTLAWKQKQRARNVEPINLYMFVSVVFFIVVSFTVGYIQKTTYYTDNKGVHRGNVEYGYAFGRYGFKDINRLENHGWVSDENWEDMKSWSDFLKTTPGTYPLRNLPSEIKLFIKYPYHEQFIYIFYNYFVYKYAYKHKSPSHDEAVTIVVEKFLHLIPKVFFILMPVLALLLNAFFFHKKGFGFLDHGVMSLHTHVFLFICGIVQLFLCSVFPTDSNYWLLLFYILIPFVHFVIATHRFYKSGWIRATIAVALTWSIYWILVFTISVLTLLLLILYA